MCQRRRCAIRVFLYKLLNPKTYGYLRRIAVAIHDLVTELEKEAAASQRVDGLMVRQWNASKEMVSNQSFSFTIV
jgi:hypothetical protein